MSAYESHYLLQKQSARCLRFCAGRWYLSRAAQILAEAIYQIAGRAEEEMTDDYIYGVNTLTLTLSLSGRGNGARSLLPTREKGWG